ncbi:MAG: DedA family protein [Rhabdochlamydiaceae bacterium]|nr:DedA family protein [Candidatus Amphrikana amoebophyrae]
MIEQVIQFISSHQTHAPWIVFAALLLAGVNIPISIDIILVFCAFLAASVIPESTYTLYFSILVGCSVSGWLAYWLGRIGGRKILATKFISKFISEEKIAKVENYYKRNGIMTLIIGRFIPFGVRNCIFLTTGISKMNFWKFAIVDFLACAAWSSLMFFAFYNLGKNFDTLKQNLLLLNICLFLAFSVTLITIFWYKYKKKKFIK